jgi:peptidoglycan hydrolase-like protein with peptidoglycan-binding domain
VRAVKHFQRSQGIDDTGIIGPKTWRRLLDFEPVSIDWSGRGSPGSAKQSTAGAPRSATLPARRYEIPPPAGRR